MDNKEYIIINKTVIQKRIEQLEEQRKYYLTQKGDYGFHNLNSVNAQLELLKAILSQSTPLIPEIEKAFDAGGAYTLASHKDFKQIHPNKKQYITNLKLYI
jgi:hypothetical protein